MTQNDIARPLDPHAVKAIGNVATGDLIDAPTLQRHGRACPGHPRLARRLL
jgi:hypothetical protein